MPYTIISKDTQLLRTHCHPLLVLPAQYCTHQRVAFHVLPPGELLPADLTGIRPLARMRAHVPLQDALVHGGKTAVWALKLLPDHCEVVNCG